MTYNSSYTGIQIDSAVGKATALFPIGYIYISVDSTSPANTFGGTWTQLKDRFLLAAGDSYSNGSTGGEETHTLSIAEMPSHFHNIIVSSSYFDIAYSGMAVVMETRVIDNGKNYGNNTDGTGQSGDYLHGFRSTGGSQSHNNMPPYLTVYMWKRVS